MLELKGKQFKIGEMIFLIIINEYKACSKNNAFIPHVETRINNKYYAGIKPGRSKIYPDPINRKLYYQMVEYKIYCPQAEFVMFEERRHNPQVEEPSALFILIRGFLINEFKFTCHSGLSGIYSKI